MANELTTAQLDELERLARRGVEEAKEFHFERSAQVGVSPFALLALIALAREGLAAREASNPTITGPLMDTF